MCIDTTFENTAADLIYIMDFSQIYQPVPLSTRLHSSPSWRSVCFHVGVQLIRNILQFFELSLFKLCFCFFEFHQLIEM